MSTRFSPVFAFALVCTLGAQTEIMPPSSSSGGSGGGGGTGDVVGPASATDTGVCLFNGATGKVIKNSLVTVDGTGVVTSVGLVSAGATVDVTTSGNEDLRLDAAGTGKLVVSDTVSSSTGVFQAPTFSFQNASAVALFSVDSAGVLTSVGHMSSGATVDETTSGNEDFRIDAAGTGKLIISDTISTTGVFQATTYSLQNASATPLFTIDATGLATAAAGFVSSGATIDLTTSGNEDLRLDAAGTGKLLVSDTLSSTTGVFWAPTYTFANASGTTLIAVDSGGRISAAGLTTTAGLTYSGVTTDITTGTNEDLTIDANGTGKIVLSDTVSSTGTFQATSYSLQNASSTPLMTVNASGSVSANAGYGCISGTTACQYNSGRSSSGANVIMLSGADAAGEIGAWAGSNSSGTAQTDFAAGHNSGSTNTFTVSGLGDAIASRAIGAAATTLATCSVTTEGIISRDSSAGTGSGVRTRMCLCTSDGIGVAYAWQNIVSGTVGTTTTCLP